MRGRDKTAFISVMQKPYRDGLTSLNFGFCVDLDVLSYKKLARVKINTALHLPSAMVNAISTLVG